MPAMKVLLGTLWLALACGSVRTTLSKSDARKAASKTLLEKVRAAWGLATGLACRSSLCLVPVQPVGHEAWGLGSSGGRPCATPALWPGGLGAASGA